MSEKTTIRKTISMPAEMGEFVEDRVRSGQYGNDSEYFRDLVRKDREQREAVAAIQEAIDEGMKGPAVRKTVRQIYDEALRLETKGRPTKRRRA